MIRTPHVTMQCLFITLKLTSTPRRVMTAWPRTTKMTSSALPSSNTTSSSACRFGRLRRRRFGEGVSAKAFNTAQAGDGEALDTHGALKVSVHNRNRLSRARENNWGGTDTINTILITQFYSEKITRIHTKTTPANIETPAALLRRWAR